MQQRPPAWSAPPDLLAEVDRSPLAWYEVERSNIRAAVAHTADLDLAELCWDLAVSTHEFYTIKGYLDDWHATHIAARDACRRTGNSRGEAAVVAILGQPALATTGRPGLPDLDDLAQAATTFERLGDQHGQAIALRTLASGLRRRGHYDHALDLLGRALSLYEVTGDAVGQWQASRNIGQTYLDLGQPDEALRVLQAAQDLASAAAQRQQDQASYWIRPLAQTTYWIGHARLALGDLSNARDAFQYVFDAVEHADDTSRAYAAHGLGEVARLAGEMDVAEQHLTTAADLARHADDAILEGRTHRSLAEVFRDRGRIDDELAALDRATSCFFDGGATHLRADMLVALGDAQARRDDLASARVAWSSAVALYREMELPDVDAIERKIEAAQEV
jgi:tetratricopeptide (TPR) repeat protein